MSESEFLGAWRERIANGETGLHLAGIDHPLEIFVGLNDSGNAKITIQSKLKPGIPKLASIVVVDRREAKGGYWWLSLTLQDAAFNEVFLRLVDDVVIRSAEADTEGAALRDIATVFEEWRRLLKPRSDGVLSREALRGLVGELWVLLNRFAREMQMKDAVVGWVGPLGQHQDFWYEGSGLHEVKSIGPTVSSIKISSEYQLDPTSDDLELVVLRVADVLEGAPGAVSLVTLVQEIRSQLGSDETAQDLLNLRLRVMGVKLSEPYYSETWFLVASESRYDVPAEFPAIRASNLPQGARQVRYKIELAAIEEFKTDLGWVL